MVFQSRRRVTAVLAQKVGFVNRTAVKGIVKFSGGGIAFGVTLGQTFLIVVRGRVKTYRRHYTIMGLTNHIPCVTVAAWPLISNGSKTPVTRVLVLTFIGASLYSCYPLIFGVGRPYRGWIILAGPFFADLGSTVFVFSLIRLAQLIPPTSARVRSGNWVVLAASICFALLSGWTVVFYLTKWPVSVYYANLAVWLPILSWLISVFFRKSRRKRDASSEPGLRFG